jgi:hypothetical protein
VSKSHLILLVLKHLVTQVQNRLLLFLLVYLLLQLKHGAHRVEENLLMVCGEMEEKVDIVLEMQVYRVDPLSI